MKLTASAGRTNAQKAASSWPTDHSAALSVKCFGDRGYRTDRAVDFCEPKQMGQFTTFGEFNDDTLRELLHEVESDLADLPWSERLAKRYYLRGIRNRLLHERGEPNPKCVALNSHLRIFPNGDVPTCQFNTRIVGNLREQSFAEVWHSARAAAQRDWVARCPGCWAECEVLPSAIYTLDLPKALLPNRRPPRKPTTAVNAGTDHLPLALTTAANRD